MAQTKEQKAVVRRWVKALRSGQYRQGKACLVRTGKTYDKFCCLGVLCDLAVLDGVIDPPEDDHGDLLYLDKESFLPKQVRDWAGLRANSGAMEDGNSLVKLNDTGKRFTIIAKIIESKPDGLFI
jgi:hypothetical protein